MKAIVILAAFAIAGTVSFVNAAEKCESGINLLDPTPIDKQSGCHDNSAVTEINPVKVETVKAVVVDALDRSHTVTFK